MTALTATPSATAGNRGRVALAITAAPAAPANSYASNFTAGLDSWTGSPSPTHFPATTPPSIRASTPIDLTADMSRVVTGLTIGAAYRLRATINRSYGEIWLSVNTTPFSTNGAHLAPPAGVRTVVELVFTPTATTHTITIYGRETVVDVGAKWYADTVTVQPAATWQGTSITRSDANGTDVPVREGPAGLDVPYGQTTLSMWDWEAALTGTVTYTAHDGNGGTATAATTFDALGVLPFLTAPATAVPGVGTVPAGVAIELVTGYTESVETAGTLHAIIGRADKVATPGPLSLRRGTVDLFCSTYAAAVAVRALAASGEILLLRQPTFPGLDMYLYPQSVAARPESENTATRRWIVSLSYEQVLAT